MSKLSSKAKMAVKKSRILFCNGYGFDELSPGLIISALEYAVEVGTSVFFDPGPRGKSLSAGTPEVQKAFGKFLRMSDVLLLTSEEVLTSTFHRFSLPLPHSTILMSVALYLHFVCACYFLCGLGLYYSF